MQTKLLLQRPNFCFKTKKGEHEHIYTVSFFVLECLNKFSAEKKGTSGHCCSPDSIFEPPPSRKGIYSVTVLQQIK